MKLIIQIPCYNEEKTLALTYRDLPKHIDGIDEIEYLIINDGSTDHTVAVARELGIQHIVSFKQNKGLAKGFVAGLDACLQLGADIIVNTDADNQYFGADIENLIRPFWMGMPTLLSGQDRLIKPHTFPGRKRNFNIWGVGWCASHQGQIFPTHPAASVRIQGKPH